MMMEVLEKAGEKTVCHCRICVIVFFLNICYEVLILKYRLNFSNICLFTALAFSIS